MTKEGYWNKNKTKLQLNERSYNAFEMGVKFCKNQIADIKVNCDYVLESKEIEYREERNKLCADFENMKATLESKIADLEQQIEKMKCCANCKSFKGYGETCEGWGEPVLNLNCDCTEWELRR